MRFLLDTHVVIWLLAGMPRVGPELYNVLSDPRHAVYVSAVSAWEIAIKVGLGRLSVPPHLEDWLPAELAAAGLKTLPIHLDHALGVERIPRLHADPFDRLLIAQAVSEDLTLVTADRAFEAYDLKLVWC